MKTRARRLLTAFPKGLALLWLILFAGSSSAHATFNELQIKASYLYNFALFSRWPTQHLGIHDTDLNLCIFGDKALAFVLYAQTLESQIDNRTITVKTLTETQSPLACHLLYIGRDSLSYQRAMLEMTTGQAILTVGESDRFIRQGGIITFRKVDGKIRFAVNVRAARQANIELGSQLLRIAHSIEGSDHEQP
jgi:hypothetical protein